MIKLSIIVPVYNAEKHLAKCLDSLVNQTDPDFEAICVDDGSTDDSLLILKEYAGKDSRFKFLTKSNGGAGSARNLGIKESKGLYTLFLDADDYLERDAVEKLYNTATKKNIDFLFYDFIYENKNNNIIKLFRFAGFSKCSKAELIKYMLLCKLPYGQHHLMKTDLIRKTRSEFSENIKNNEELVFKLRLIYEAENIAFTDYMPYHYVKHGQSLSKKNSTDKNEIEQEVISKVEDILKAICTDEQDYKTLIETYKAANIILRCYGICNRGTFFNALHDVKKLLMLPHVISKIDNADKTLFPANVEKLHKLLKVRMYFWFVVACKAKTFINKYKMRK